MFPSGTVARSLNLFLSDYSGSLIIPGSLWLHGPLRDCVSLFDTGLALHACFYVNFPGSLGFYGFLVLNSSLGFYGSLIFNSSLVAMVSLSRFVARSSLVFPSQHMARSGMLVLSHIVTARSLFVVLSHAVGSFFCHGSLREGGSLARSGSL